MVDRSIPRRNPVLFAAVVFLSGWILLGAMTTIGEMSTEPAYEFIGQTPASGWVGVLVMFAAIGLLILLYGELGDVSELPDRFPPERDR